MYDFYSQCTFLLATFMLLYYWSEMNEFAQACAIVSLFGGSWGAAFTILIICVATATTDRHID